MIAKIQSSESLTIFLDGRTHSVRKTDKKYAAFEKAVEAEDENAIRVALGGGELLKSYSKGVLSVVDGEVVYDGSVINNVVTDKILALFNAGKKYQYMLNFLSRVKANPSTKAVEELYLFLEKAQIPITPDGHFLAYRKVDNNYNSYHVNPDGTYNSNKVGEVCKMDRQSVDSDRNQTCSKGLHFCSFSYLSSYHGGSGRVMIVKIDPANVVSIPSDYSNSKGRCCEYTVVAEHVAKEKEEAYKDVVLANPDGSVHEGRDIEASEVKFAKKTQTKNKLHKRIVGYIRAKLDSNRKPTIRQIQSTLSPVTPTVSSLVKTVERLGFKVKVNKVLSKSVVSE